MSDLIIFSFGLGVCLVVGAALSILIIQRDRSTAATSQKAARETVHRK